MRLIAQLSFDRARSGIKSTVSFLMQWLEDLPNDEARQKVYDKVMQYFKDGTIKPPLAGLLKLF